MSPLSKVFELNHKGLNVPRALIILGVLGVPLIVMEAVGWSVYWVSLAMAALFVGLSDPGGEFAYRGAGKNRVTSRKRRWTLDARRFERRPSQIGYRPIV